MIETHPAFYGLDASAFHCRLPGLRMEIYFGIPYQYWVSAYRKSPVFVQIPLIKPVFYCRNIDSKFIDQFPQCESALARIAINPSFEIVRYVFDGIPLRSIRTSI